VLHKTWNALRHFAVGVTVRSKHAHTRNHIFFYILKGGVQWSRVGQHFQILPLLPVLVQPVGVLVWVTQYQRLPTHYAFLSVQPAANAGHSLTDYSASPPQQTLWKHT